MTEQGVSLSGMRNRYWLTGTFLFGISCSSGESTKAGQDPPPGDLTTREGRVLPPADEHGVRIAGGETADFGNGTDTPCGTRTVETVISQEQAESEGLDVEAERAWLAAVHGAPLLYNPSECASAPEVCNDTRVELQAQVVDVIRVQGRSTRPSQNCPAEWQAFSYRLAVHLASEDGNLLGTFYARAGRSESDTGVITVRGAALADLRNFEGQLPIEIEPSRPHHAFMGVRFALASDGTASGELEPAASYYDGSSERPGLAQPIGPQARFGADVTHDPEEVRASVLADEVTAFTLTTYPGSNSEPLVDLRVRADAVEPMTDVELTIQVDGEEVRAETVAPGTYVELGLQPFGTRVSVDVHNTNGAGLVRANVLQDDCFAATSACDTEDCTTHVDYTAAHRLCVGE